MMEMRMIQKFKLLGAVAGITFAGALAASAATFSIDGGVNETFPTAGTGSGDYTLPLPVPLPASVQVFRDGFAGLGLKLSNGARLLFTYLGEDANFRNKSFTLGDLALFDTKTSIAGDTLALALHPAGLVDLLFTTNGGPDGPDGSIENGVGGTAGLSLGFSLSADLKTAYAFFDDGGSAPGLGGAIDLDYDDLAFSITATPVPVPAGGLLLISGLGALAVARRRKQA
jgi:hypothetical protein